jgi:hypothetical protein
MKVNLKYAYEKSQTYLERTWFQIGMFQKEIKNKILNSSFNTSTKQFLVYFKMHTEYSPNYN